MGALSGSNFLQALGWAVLNSLWQMAFLWVAYQLISAAFVKRAKARNLLATLLLTAGFVWFLYSFVSLLQFNEPASVPGMTALLVDEQVNNWFFTSLPVASVVYLTFLVIPLWNFIRSYRYVRIIRREGLHRANAELRLFVTKVRERMGIRKEVQIWLSDFVKSPVTIGFLKPVILLPLAAISQLTPAQTEAILLHELAHIRRFDYLVNLTVRLIQAVLYFNPFVKEFARIIEMEREKTCDNMVLQFQYEPHGYASALLALERQARNVQLLTIPAFTGKKSQLLSRVESIMGIHAENGFSLARSVRTFAGIGCCITFLIVVMLSHPVQLKHAEGRLASYLSPFLMYPADEEPATEVASVLQIINEPSALEIQRHVAQPPVNVPIETPAPADAETSSTGGPVAMFANYNADAVAPEEEKLDKEQLRQVQVAVETSRKVLEDIKWKDIETSIADAMTQAQKEIAKQAFKQKVEQQNWDKMEDKLKLSYEKIDWAEINKNLSNAMIQIKYDSLQHVYNLALNGLNELQKELEKTEIKGIPDTDITVTAVRQKQEELQAAAEKIRKARTKKIIQL